MTDRELPELAAKAAGMWPGDFELDDDMQPVLSDGKGFRLTWGSGWWNPITDDGDAFRLAVKLRIDIEHGSPLDSNAYVCSARCGIEMVRDPVSAIEEVDGEAYRAAATRRAITRAAAEIGRGLSSDPSKRKELK